MNVSQCCDEYALPVLLYLDPAEQRLTRGRYLQLNAVRGNGHHITNKTFCYAGAICRRQDAGALCVGRESVRLPVPRVPHETREDASDEGIRTSQVKASFCTPQYRLLHATDRI